LDPTSTSRSRRMSLNPLETPLNTALALFIAYQVASIVFPAASRPKKLATSYAQGYNWRPERHPDSSVFKDYSPKTLEPFSGRNGGKILLAIDRKVFDVTAGGSFYGPDGMYGNFAGRDASRGMAKQSFDEDMLTPVDQRIDKLENMDASEIENMNGWVEHFTYKYIIVGRLVENDEL